MPMHVARSRDGMSTGGSLPPPPANLENLRNPENRLYRPTDAVLQALAVAAAEGEPGAVLEEHDVFAVEPRLQLADLLDVDDVAAVNADERLRRELSLDRVHRLANQVRVVADVQLDVVAGRFDPVDLGRANEE